MFTVRRSPLSSTLVGLLLVTVLVTLVLDGGGSASAFLLISFLCGLVLTLLACGRPTAGRTVTELRPALAALRSRAPPA